MTFLAVAFAVYFLVTLLVLFGLFVAAAYAAPEILAYADDVGQDGRELLKRTLGSLPRFALLWPGLLGLFCREVSLAIRGE